MGFNKNFYDELKQSHGFPDIKFNSEDSKKFWLDMKFKESQSGKETINGKIQVQIDVFPAEAANKNPVGKARQEPNHSPFLPTPQGRIVMTLNPFKMYQQLIGPEFRAQIFKVCCCITCIIAIAFFLPNISGALTIVESFIRSIT